MYLSRNSFVPSDEALDEITALLDKVNSNVESKISSRYKITNDIKNTPAHVIRRELEQQENISSIDGLIQGNTELIERLNNVTTLGNKIVNALKENTEFLENDLKKFLYNAKVGTLQGLARDTMEREGITPHPEDEYTRDFLQQWDAEERKNHGGKQKRRKTKRIQRKMKKNTKKKNFR
jgi:hypothetical protein